MTGCLYFAPLLDASDSGKGCVPAILADTLATFPDLDAPAVLPANVTKLATTGPSRVSIARKSYVLGGHTAIAFAGDGNSIAACLNEMASQVGAWEQDEIPTMRLAAMRADYPGVEAVGATLRPPTLSTLIQGEVHNLGRMGHRCCAIGSGAEQLIQMCRQQSIDPPAVEQRTAFNDVITLWMIANATRLAENLNPATKADWGGFLELLYVDENSNWTRASRSIHFFVAVSEVREGRATLRILPRVVAYDAQLFNGRILTIDAGDGHANLFHFALRDVVEGDFKLTPEEETDYWKNWKPEHGTISAMRVDDHRGDLSIRILDGLTLPGIIFEVGDGTVSFGLTDELMRTFAEDTFQSYGMDAAYCTIEEYQMLAASGVGN